MLSFFLGESLISELSLKPSVLTQFRNRFDDTDVAVRSAVKQLA